MESQIPQILKQVKSNKKYKTISSEIVLNEIKNHLKKNPNEPLNDFMIKEIRKNLHRLYSTYSSKKNKRNKLLEELKTNPNNKEIIKKILRTSVSANERLDSYPKIYSEIFRLTIQKPNKIIDLGCGLNPLSFPFMHLKQLTYHAYDIDEQDIQFLNDYFNIMKLKGLNGKAQILDVRNLNSISKLPSVDVIFIFKLIDLIDIDNHKTSEELIKILFKENKAKFIVASFATKTITRKQMNFPRRKWFELMLSRIGLKFETFSIKNEVFYVISKLPQIL